jgi:hypothetical protein
MVYIQPFKHDLASSPSSVAKFSRSSSEILASCSNELGVTHILPRQRQIHLLIQSRWLHQPPESMAMAIYEAGGYSNIERARAILAALPGHKVVVKYSTLTQLIR